MNHPYTARAQTLLLPLLFLASTAVSANPRPNVILMMADDLGYQDLSGYGSTRQKTPVLDRLASEGLQLTSYYAGATVCTPSRMALLTGAYPPRLGWRGGVVGYGIKTVNGLAPQARTLGEVFKEAGYRTALIGKWHLGDTPELHPQAQGFDTTYFIDKSNNQTKKLWRGRKIEADPFDNRRLTENFTRESMQFIQVDSDKPFLLYLPFTAPHFPAQAHPQWQGRSRNDAYGDVVEELDARVGEILNTLKKGGLEKNTLVIFTSDNGPEPGQKRWATAGVYRGLKWSALEGGTRVPCILRWPGVLPAGKLSDHLTSAIDLLPTLAGACGIKLGDAHASTPKLDGLDLWASLTANAAEHPRTELLYWHGWAIPQAIRVGEWKLYFDKVKELPATNNGPVLIHLAEDPAEKNDLSGKHPDRVHSMMERARQQLADIEKNRISLGGPADKKGRTPKRAHWLQ